MNKLIAREQECARLDRCMKADTSQLVVVYGRRRVGKTFLINEYFKNEFAFKLTGSFDQPKELQLRNFVAELNRKTKKDNVAPKDWIEAFELLRNYLSRLPKKKKQVIFFDEMPWLDTHKSGFISAFEFFWNDFGSSQDNLVFIVCGSATAWMMDKLAKNKGGLFNRQTCKLFLEPFNLAQTKTYLKNKGILWSDYDIAECYMVMGGIPYYLSLLDASLSYVKNIDNLFFKKNAELFDEFEHLYNTLFTNSEKYIAVVEALSEKRNGYTRNEIARKTGLPANGQLTLILNNLAYSGFIRTSTFFGKKKKEMLFQLADYYTNFYFKFVKANYDKDENYWSNAIDLPARRVWAGLTFEQLCKDHIKQIKEKIGISGVLTEQYTWSSRGNDDLKIAGTQIDLLIDRRDRVINLCEIKFSMNEFAIDKEYYQNLMHKIETFRKFTSTNSGIQLTMITTFGVKENKYSSIVGSQITLNDLFK